MYSLLKGGLSFDIGAVFGSATKLVTSVQKYFDDRKLKGETGACAWYYDVNQMKGLANVDFEFF